MRHLFSLGISTLGLLGVSSSTYAQAPVGVGIGTLTPDASAALDVTSSRLGLLAPRLALTSPQDAATVRNPANGLFLYNTSATVGSAPGLVVNIGTPSAPAWRPLADDLGNHIAQRELNLQSNALIGTGSNLGSAVGIGVRADGGFNMGQNTPGPSNVLIGYLAGAAVQGGYNTFVGVNTGQNNTLAEKNSFFGQNAGYSTTTGPNNTFLGQFSGFANTTGYQNTFVGQNSGHNNSTGGDNTFIGQSAGEFTTTGTSNVFMGSRAGNSNLTGGNNTFIGQGASGLNTTGTGNTFVGWNVAQNNTNGSYNVALGYEAGPATAGLNNATAIGFRAVVGQSDALVLGGFGQYAVKVGIGTPNPNEALHVIGNILASGTITQNSDARLKTNVRPLAGALASVAQLRGVRYTFLPGKGPTGEQIGVIAQEIEAIYPELVRTDSRTGIKSVNYAQLTPVLLEAIKELRTQLATTQQTQAHVTAALDALTTRLQALEATASR